MRALFMFRRFFTERPEREKQKEGIIVIIIIITIIKEKDRGAPWEPGCCCSAAAALPGWLTGITMPTDGTMQSNIMSSTRNVSFLEDDASRWWRTAFQSAEAFLARRIMRRFFTV